MAGKRKRSNSVAARKGPTKKGRTGFSSVARTRGAAVTGEMKYFDCTKSLSALTANASHATAIQDPDTTLNLGDAAVATPQCLFAPKVSAALNGREGRKVKMYHVKVKGHINVAAQAAQAAADTSCDCRVILVMDMQTNATQMTGTQLLTTTGSTDTAINAFQNPDNFGRFKVLKDKVITMTNANLTGSPTTADVVQSGMIRKFKLDHKFKKPVQVNFNATNGGTVADIVNNSLHIFAECNNTLLAPTITYYSRVGYKER